MEESTQSENSALDIDALAKSSLSAIVQFVRSTHEFPSAGDDYEFYSSFAGFRSFVSDKKSWLLKNITLLLKNQGLKKNFTGASTDLDEYADSLIECNDGLLERVSVLLDQCSGIRRSKDNHPKENATMAPSQVNTASKPLISSWNKVNHQGKSRTFRLMHAHNILRPQLKFKDPVDNTSAPFVPLVKTKPNALKPLSASLLNIHKKDAKNLGPSLAIASLIEQARSSKQEDLSIYEHPYQYELDNWTPTPNQMSKVTPQMFDAMNPDTCVMIDRVDQLEELMSELKSHKEFAVDLEHHSYRTYQGITCLMQLSTRQHDYIIDTLALRSNLQILNEVFTDPNIVKVLHGADSDVLWLQRDLGVYIVNLFDTGQASRTLSLARNSLDFLLHHYCGITADKRFQLADWRVRPLPKEMMYYAQADTHYLLYIYDMMLNQLLERANGEDRLLRVVLNNSRNICLVRYEKQVTTSESHLHMLERMKRKGKRKEFNPQQMEALRLLYGWRDAMARREDESPGYVLPNHMLLQIAEILPRDSQGVLACCNPIPPLLRQHVMVVHQLVLDARMKSLNRASVTSTPKDKTLSELNSSALPQVVDVYSDILRCPHDLSRGDIVHANSLADNVHSQNQVTMKSTSNLFGPPLASLASSPGRKQLNGSMRYASTTVKAKEADLVKRLKAMQQSVWDPFDLFMPGRKSKVATKRPSADDDTGATDGPLTLRHMLSGNFVWKMRKLENAVDPPSKEGGDAEPKSFGTVVNIDDGARQSTEEQVQVLRHLMKSEKGHSGRGRRQPAAAFAKRPKSAETTDFVPPTWRRGRGGKPHMPPKAFVPRQFSDEDFSRFRQKRGAMKKRKFK